MENKDYFISNATKEIKKTTALPDRKFKVEFKSPIKQKQFEKLTKSEKFLKILQKFDPNFKLPLVDIKDAKPKNQVFEVYIGGKNVSKSKDKNLSLDSAETDLDQHRSYSLPPRSSYKMLHYFNPLDFDTPSLTSIVQGD